MKLPDGWVECCIDDVTENHDGTRVPVKLSDRASRQGAYPYYGASGAIDQVDDYLFDGEYLLVAEDGANLLSRSTPIAFSASGKFWVNNHAHVLKERQGVVRDYVRHFLNATDLAPYVTGTAQPKLTQKNLNRLPLKIPATNEQRRIVDKIEALTARSRRAKEALDAVPALLDKLRQSILAAAFRGDLTKEWRAAHPNVEPASVLLDRIRKERRARWEEAELAKMRSKGSLPKDDKWKSKYVEPEPVNTDDLPELPEGWAWASLETLTVISGGIAKGEARRDQQEYVEVPYLRVANVQRGYLLLDDVRTIEVTVDKAASLRLEAGDILLNEGGDRDKLGRGWVWEGQIANCIHQNHVFRARPATQDVNSRYVSHYANALGQDFFMDQGKQTTNLASVSMSKIRRLPIALAPELEQKAILNIVETALETSLETRRFVERCKEQAEALNSAILAKAFRGELVPQDPNDEPASALLERIRAERESGVTTSPTKKTRAKRATKTSKRASG